MTLKRNGKQEMKEKDQEKMTLKDKANNGFHCHVVFNVLNQFYRACGSWKIEDYEATGTVKTSECDLMAKP